MNKIAVLIPDGDDDRALIVVRGFSYSKNIKVHVLASKNSNLFLSKHCKTHKFVQGEDGRNSRLNHVVQIAENYKIDILFPIGELGTKFVISNFKVLQKLFLIPPIPEMNVLNLVGDKWLLNEFTNNTNILYPKSFLFDSHTNINSLDLTYPVLLKPRIGAGGIGIAFFETRDKLLSVLESQDGIMNDEGYIIQEFVEGSDIDLSALCLNGEILAYTIQRPVNKQKKSFSFGKIIELIDHPAILSLGKKCFSSLKWNGVAHIDFIHNDKNNQFYMIDFNPRYWGTLIGSITGGVNFPHLACLTAQGIKFPLPEYDNSKFAILKASNLFSWLFGVDYLKEIPFSHTNLKYVITDPLPALKL